METFILSVSDARKLLGKEYEMITNEDLIMIINDIETVVTIVMRMYLRSKNVNIY